MKPYPAYKDSGVEWIGEVPAGWRIVKTKQVAAFFGGGTPDRDTPDFWNGDIPWISPKDMKRERVNSSEEHITELGANLSAATMVNAGAVLIVVRSGILKHSIPAAINDVAVTLNQDMKAVLPDESRLIPVFFQRIIQGHNDQLLHLWRKQGATVESLEIDLLTETRLALPPIVEQRAIAAFLDRETAQIDALIAKYRSMIDLLREKRQAMISRAVTKGLDLSVAMKDSGVEWLGEVPAGWRVGALKLFLDENLTYGANESADHANPEDPRYIRITDVDSDGKLRPDTFRSLPPETAKPYMLKDGDILLARSGATVGKTFLYRDTMGPCCFAGYLIRARFSISMTPNYVNFFFSSLSYRAYIER